MFLFRSFCLLRLFFPFCNILSTSPVLLHLAWLSEEVKKNIYNEASPLTILQILVPSVVLYQVTYHSSANRF